jgi:hypothetical protein
MTEKNVNVLNELANQIAESINKMDLHDAIDSLNQVRAILHKASPMKNEPVDFVKWVLSDDVVANDYNPNKVAPPEMELLEVSIMNDGYTQPIVSWSNPEKGKIEVIDGFHRNRVGRESAVVKERVKGFLPVVDIRETCTGKNDRIASTIRHNRARGKHQVDAMSEIVIELKNRNWTNKRISKQLGMDEEEVLRLCQISGLDHLFGDQDFSKSWESDDAQELFYPLEDDVSEEQMSTHRIPNENDSNRIFHTYDKWECYKAGFYKSTFLDKSKEWCLEAYATFLRDDDEFRKALKGVTSEWKYSCEHYLTNSHMNRIAWLGQASMCYATGVPSVFCSGYNLLTDEEKKRADTTALEYLNKWLENHEKETADFEEASNINKQVELY